MFVCKRNHSGSCILNMLKALGSLFRQSIQKWITEVQSGSNERVHKYFCCIATDIYFLIRLIFRRWKKPALHTAVTGCSIDMTVSYRRPIFLAVDVLLISSSQTEIDVRGGGWRWLAFKTTRSVLSLFILSMFTVIQASISRTQSSITNLARSAVDDLKVRYNCVSSAYKWKLTLWCLIISPKGEVWSRNKIGPRTLSWLTDWLTDGQIDWLAGWLTDVRDWPHDGVNLILAHCSLLAL